MRESYALEISHLVVLVFVCVCFVSVFVLRILPSWGGKKNANHMPVLNVSL